MALTKVSTGVVDMSGSTGALEIAKGATTAVAAPLGTLRANTTTNKMEVYASTGWRILKEGGDVLTALTVDYLAVAGGGAGGNSYGASGSGGGAGEFLYKTGQSLAAGVQYNVTIGAGSICAASPNSPSPNGGDSTFNSDTTNGGGGGVNAEAIPNPGISGGSGSGGLFNGTGGSSLKTAGGLGNSGGAGGPVSGRYTGGGGGGASTAGGAGASTLAGNGGDGESNSITGTAVIYSAGGGGGNYGVNPTAQGGSSGIGGNASITGVPATPTNYGCGGAGGSYNGALSIAYQGGNASDGVVILRYPDAYQINLTAGASPAFNSTNAVVGADTIVTTITAGSGTITFSLKP